LDPTGSILVVSDDRAMGKFIGNLLQPAGYRAYVTNDSQAAIEWLATEPALVIVDLRSSGSSRPRDVIESAAAHTPRLGIIALIDSGGAALTSALRAGADRVIRYPFSPHLLLEAVRHLVSSAKAGGDTQ